MTNNKIFILVVSIFMSIVSVFGQEKDSRPNIVLIMGDDIGFSDIGSFGGEIETPNIDRLANEGVRFTNFYNMAKCSPTRSSLLTGLYTGGNGAVHLAHLTKASGYTNIMSGKEHFDNWVPEYCKAENAFDHSFSFWATTEYFLPPSGKFSEPYFLEGKQLAPSNIEHEISPMYQTDFITDYALNWLDESIKGEDKPFFLYLPYHAAHYPLQARPEDIQKYKGKYKKGWDALRKERFKKMKKLGVIPESTQLSPPEKDLNNKKKPFVPEYKEYYPWDDLSEKKKDSLDLEMAVYAAIVDRMDQNIGRVLKKLEEENKLENTIVLFLVDNGSCPFFKNQITDVQPGPANSYWSLRTSWANLGNTPYRQYKQAGHEGGSHTPFIAYWPHKIKPNTITDQPAHVVDIAPTFLNILDMEYPETIHEYPTEPLHGTSLIPIFEGKKRKEPDYFVSGVRNMRMFRSGDYKIVQMNGGSWELYNIKTDPTELNDIAISYPEKVKELDAKYKKTPLGIVDGKKRKRTKKKRVK